MVAAGTIRSSRDRDVRLVREVVAVGDERYAMQHQLSSISIRQAHVNLVSLTLVEMAQKIDG